MASLQMRAKICCKENYLITLKLYHLQGCYINASHSWPKYVQSLPPKAFMWRKNIFLTPEHCNLMCNCNGIPSCEEKHWSLHQSFDTLQWALSAIAMELYHGQSTFNPSALKRASCLICGATQGNKAALAGNLTQAFCQRPWLRKKRDFFFSISYRSWKGQLRRGTSMLADVEYL